MLHLLSQHNYSPEDWDLMQRAHAKASQMLGRCQITHEHANRLARIVMRLFDQGLRDDLLIAARAAEQEHTRPKSRTNVAAWYPDNGWKAETAAK